VVDVRDDAEIPNVFHGAPTYPAKIRRNWADFAEFDATFDTLCLFPL